VWGIPSTTTKVIAGSIDDWDYPCRQPPSFWNRNAEAGVQSWKETAINANRDDYLNSALADDHRAFGYQGNIGDPNTDRPRSRWQIIAALLAIAAVGYAGFTW
jgi:hypothetical protein